MKKLIILLLLFTPQVIFAQTIQAYLIPGYYNRTNPEGNKAHGNNATSEAFYSYAAGVLYEFNVKPRLNINTGLGITRHGDYYTLPSIVITPQQGFTQATLGSSYSSFRYLYLDVPVYVKYFIDTASLHRLYITGGLEFNYLAHAALVSDKTGSKKTINMLNADNSNTDYNRINYSYMLGFGDELSLSEFASVIG